MTVQEYCREVIAKLADVNTEGVTYSAALKAKGLEADILRGAMDAAIASTFDKQQLDFMRAMKIAGIKTQQAANVIAAWSALQGED